jgi:hypothetical protein
MFSGLLLLFGHLAAEEQLSPILGSAALAVILGMLLMLVMVVRAGTAIQVRSA